MHRTLLALSLLAGALASAQTGDEWNSPFPKPGPAKPPAPPPSPAAPAAPAAAPVKKAPAPAQPAASPAPAPAKVAPKSAKEAPAAPKASPAAAKKEVAVDAASASGGTAGDELPIVSKQERLEPGSEPHSPGTWGNAWDAKENSRVMVGQVGLGTVLLPSARLGHRGIVRVSLLADYLNLNEFPVRNARDIRSAVTFAASWQIFDWGEAFVGYSASANTNDRTAPALIQALGDLTLGVKASKEWTRGLWAGGDLRLLTFSGVGNQSIDRFAVAARPMLLVTYDVRTLTPKAPLLATLGLGFTIDGTSGLVTSSQRLNASEEFALGINRYHRFNLGLAVEAPLPVVTPYLEYNLGVPLGVAGGQLEGPDNVPVPVGAAMPQTLGLGAKITALKDLTVLFGFDFGLTRSVGMGIAATPPWNMHLGAAFAIDPYQKGEARVLETVRERKVEQKVPEAPRTARIEGSVVDASSKKPVEGVILTVVGAPPAATDAAGRFTTVELPAVQAKLLASRDGYKSLTQELKLEAGRPAKVELALEPEVKKATFLVSTRAENKGVKAEVKFEGTSQQAITTAEGAAEPSTLEAPAGDYTVTVNAAGYLSQTRQAQTMPGGTMKLAFELSPVPKKPLVIFKGDKIEILQQVHFASGKATILADSYSLLNQVVDAIVKNSVKKVRVEGHTDNRGGKEFNQKLSEDRARAVVEFLTSAGVEASHLESGGFGDSKPIAPNLTARGRELNRRVEFLVLEK